jgi:hypothetical protein
MIQKKYRSHCKKKIEQNLKNYFTGFDNSGEYVNFIYLDKNEVDNNNIQNIYYKVYSCKNQSDSQKKYNINELYEINAIDNKNLNEDYINSNKKKIANTIFKEYCKQNNIEIQDDNIEEYDNYNFDDVDNKRDFEESIEDNFDKLKNENNNKVIEEHVDQISESIPLKNDSLNKPIDEPLEEEKKEKNEEEEFYFDKEEIEEKPIDERENSKEIHEEKVENREEEEKVENKKESFNEIEVENIEDENSKGIQEEKIKDYEEEKKTENKDNNEEDNENVSQQYYFDNEEINEKPIDERNSEDEKINKEIATLN